MRHIVWFAVFLFAFSARCDSVFVSVSCKAFGRYAHCESRNAERLALPTWEYASKPGYTVHGLKAVIEVKQNEWTPLTFYATDAKQTHVVSIQLRIKDHRATFCDPEKEDCDEKR